MASHEFPTSSEITEAYSRALGNIHFLTLALETFYRDPSIEKAKLLAEKTAVIDLYIDDLLIKSAPQFLKAYYEKLNELGGK